MQSDGSAPPKQLTSASMAVDDFRFAPAWSPDGTHVAYYSNRSDYWEDDIWVVEVATGAERQISSGLMASSTPVWSPDGSRIALLATSKDEYWYEDLAYVYLLDPEVGTEEVVPMQIHATDWLHNHTVTWSGDGSELFFPYHERAEVELWRVPADGGVATRVTNMGGSFRAYHATPDGSAFVFLRSTSTRGTEVDYVSAAGGAARRLTHFSTRWRGLVEAEEVSYRSWDGLYIQGFLFRPPGFTEGGDAVAPERATTHPALVMVHGGGTNSYLKGLSLTEQHLAQRGYVVLAVNYRGGSGFGREFQDLGVGDWANGQALDAAAAADFLRAQPWSNGKVGIYGYSYGGHSEHGGDRPGTRRLRRRGAHGGDLRLRRRLHQRGPAGQDVHQDRTRGRTPGPARSLRHQQHPGARAERGHAHPHHARGRRRACPVSAVRTRGGYP